MSTGTYKSSFLKDMESRGAIHQITDPEALDAALMKGCVTAYAGYDCTGPSLHVGHLISIMMLRRLQQAGHKPIVLIGGGTTKVGDPSGKDETRKILTQKEINSNKASIKRVFARFLKFGDGQTDALMVDNDDWLRRLGYIHFLREYGRHFSVNRMLSFDSVKMRLEREQPLSFIEFNYMLLQAYDFLELSRRHNCTLQMGGSDQWGNIVNGVELARRVDGKEIFGLTTPLLTTSTGAKMGKTAKGAVWINAEDLSPYDYWQFWRNTEDGDAGRFLRLFTDLPLAKIKQLEALEGAEINEAKKVLATEATALAHGRAAAQEAAETAQQTFAGEGTAAGLPTVELPKGELEKGVGVLNAFVQAGLAASNSEVRRQIQGGAVRVNDQPVHDDRAMVTAAMLSAEGVIKLSLGKKKHVLIRAV
jgi:tyrosyl-tRNA synthetase